MELVRSVIVDKVGMAIKGLIRGGAPELDRFLVFLSENLGA